MRTDATTNLFGGHRPQAGSSWGHKMAVNFGSCYFTLSGFSFVQLHTPFLRLAHSTPACYFSSTVHASKSELVLDLRIDRRLIPLALVALYPVLLTALSKTALPNHQGEKKRGVQQTNKSWGTPMHKFSCDRIIGILLHDDGCVLSVV